MAKPAWRDSSAARTQYDIELRHLMLAAAGDPSSKYYGESKANLKRIAEDILDSNSVLDKVSDYIPSLSSPGLLAKRGYNILGVNTKVLNSDLDRFNETLHLAETGQTQKLASTIDVNKRMLTQHMNSGYSPNEFVTMKARIQFGIATPDDMLAMTTGAGLTESQRRELAVMGDIINKFGLHVLSKHELSKLDPHDPKSWAELIESRRPADHRHAGIGGTKTEEGLFIARKTGLLSDIDELANVMGVSSDERKVKDELLDPTNYIGGLLGKQIGKHGLALLTKPGSIITKRSPINPSAKPYSATPKPVKPSGGFVGGALRTLGSLSKDAAIFAAGGYAIDKLMGSGPISSTIDSLPNYMENIESLWDDMPEQFKEFGLSLLGGAAVGLLGSITPAGMRKIVTSPISVIRKLSSKAFKSNVDKRRSVEGTSELYESQYFSGEPDNTTIESIDDVNRAANKEQPGLGLFGKILGAAGISALFGAIGSAVARQLSFIKPILKWTKSIILKILSHVGLSRLGDKLAPGGAKGKVRGRGGRTMMLTAALAAVLGYAGYEEGSWEWDNIFSKVDNLYDSVSGFFGGDSDNSNSGSIAAGVKSLFGGNPQSGTTTGGGLGSGKSIEQHAGNKQKFIKEFGPLAAIAARELGVDPRIIIAQAGIETGWGKSLAGGNNYFGIKTHGWKGKSSGPLTTREFENDWIKDSFRNYDSAEESALDYVHFLRTNKRYTQALEIGKTGDSIGYITAIHRAGYATDPNYAEQIISIARDLPAMNFSIPAAPVSKDESNDIQVASNQSVVNASPNSGVANPLIGSTNTSTNSATVASTTSTSAPTSSTQQHVPSNVAKTSTPSGSSWKGNVVKGKSSMANSIPDSAPDIMAAIRVRNRHFFA